MLVKVFKDLCWGLGWFFNYGDYAWQNLNDFADDTICADDDGKLPEPLPTGTEQGVKFLLLWKDREKVFNEFNVVTAHIFEGEFLLVVRSKMDDKDHNEKYEKRIKKMEDKVDSFQSCILDCDDFYIKMWKEVEVENELDTNVDGIKVRFKIRHEL